MFNVTRIASLAKLLFPNKAQVIDQAASMAQNFTPSKDGVAQLMAQYGKTRQDMQNAVKMLDSPLAKTLMNKVPGLETALRSAANEVQASTPPNPGIPPVQEVTQIFSTGNTLADRLKKLK